MEKAKRFLFKHFEKFLVVPILLGVVAMNYFVSYKLGFLNFFYLPIIMAGYLLGKRMAVLTAFLCISTVVLFLFLFPSSFFIPETTKAYVIVSLTGWSSFLILTSAALGYLYEEKERRIVDLKGAYIGVLEILSKYLESADRYTQGHSVRVAHLAEDMSRALGLPPYERENIKVAALLHDVGKTDVSMGIVDKAASLTAVDKEFISKSREKGTRIIALVGEVLKEAVPIVLAHRKYYFEGMRFPTESKEPFPIGAAIIGVADAYDEMITDLPHRAGKLPWTAYEEIEKESGRQFHPKVVKALKGVLIESEKHKKDERKALKNIL